MDLGKILAHDPIFMIVLNKIFGFDGNNTIDFDKSILYTDEISVLGYGIIYFS
jgi:hypothetical protein